MPAPIFSANADYCIIDRSPLILEEGEAVVVGAADRVWPGWIAVTTRDGRFTYVPESGVAVGGGNAGTMLSRFDATDLSVRKGEMVVSLREMAGWHWARGAAGAEGWVPGYVLDPA